MVLIWKASIVLLFVVGYSSLHCGTIPINAVVWLMSIDHNIVLEVTLLVFADSYLGLSNGNFATVFARYLVNHSSLILLWNMVL